MRVTVRIAGLAAAVALVLWSAAIATHSFRPQDGSGFPRLDGGAGLQLLLGAATFVTAGLVTAAAFALVRPACRRGRPFWVIVCLLGWAALSAAVASRAAGLFLAHVNYEMGVGPGEPSVVAPAWGAWFWTVTAVCTVLAAALLVRWALAVRSAGESPLGHSLRG